MNKQNNRLVSLCSEATGAARLAEQYVKNHPLAKRNHLMYCRDSLIAALKLVEQELHENRQERSDEHYEGRLL